MSQLQLTRPRATLEEVLEFANRVRKAGGAEPLEALLPGIPQDAKKCLIAKNLNFDCGLAPYTDNFGRTQWIMSFPYKSVRDAVAEELDLEKLDRPRQYIDGLTHCIVLPRPIAAVADAYDRWIDAHQEVLHPCTAKTREKYQAILDEFTPYVEASYQRAIKRHGY